MDGERDLWISVLIRAIYDLRGVGLNEHKKHAALLERSARTWFISPDSGIGSYCWICGLLGLDPLTVRERVFEEVPKLIGRRAWWIPHKSVNGNRACAYVCTTSPAPPPDLAAARAPF